MPDPTSDCTAAVVVPTNVEKLPLYHWAPGTRLLAIGDRAGPRFDDTPPPGRDFLRPLSHDLLRAAATRVHTQGFVTSWSNSLARHDAVCLVRDVAQAMGQPVVIATPGFGDHDLLASLVPFVAAWLLYCDQQPGPLCHCILRTGRHVEVVYGVSHHAHAGAAIPDLPWASAAAVHVVPRRPHELVGEALDRAITNVHDQLPAGPARYGMGHYHTPCPHCGAMLVWRANGRCRRESWDAEHGVCSACGGRAPFTQWASQ